MTKINNFVEKGYYNHSLFVLNVAEIINENASSSAYLIDSFDLWHARLGHVSNAQIKKMLQLGLISINNTCMRKCEICFASKQSKKTCSSTFRESELLSLIHADLGDLKQSMTRGDKKNNVTFIDDFSRYTKVYLLRNKDKAFDMLLIYKTEVENQLNRKIKRVRLDRGVSMFYLIIFVKSKG